MADKAHVHKVGVGQATVFGLRDDPAIGCHQKCFDAECGAILLPNGGNGKWVEKADVDLMRAQYQAKKAPMMA